VMFKAAVELIRSSVETGECFCLDEVKRGPCEHCAMKSFLAQHDKKEVV